MGVDDDLGTIQPGKLADLVVVTGDPHEFGTLGERVEQVWKAGPESSERPQFPQGATFLQFGTASLTTCAPLAP